ncbi:MAG TPA: chorismate mutase [Candidatus Nanoarchaeia archaeon]|nr:chorismate mutase [Candidatus Nanoarchaeia archaeon]
MKKLAIVRNEIEAIDRELINLIAKRTNLARDVLEAKKHEDKPINDEGRNHEVLERVSNIATECGLDGGEVKNIFKILIKMSIERQHELSGEGNLP